MDAQSIKHKIMKRRILKKSRSRKN